MLYSQRSNIGWLSPGIFYIPKWLPGSYSAMGFPLFSCCWNIDATSLQKSYLMPMFKYKSLMWGVPFCSSSHLSDACRQLAEGTVLGCGGRECVNRWGKKWDQISKHQGRSPSWEIWTKRSVSLAGRRWLYLVQSGKEDPLINISLRQLLRELFLQVCFPSQLWSL